MPTDTKKRKLEASSSGSSTVKSTSKDVNKLQSSLKKCNASALLQSLSDSLDDVSPKNIQVLKVILDPLLEVDAQPKHCVRCHQTFREEDKTRKSCVVLCGGEYDMTAYVDEEYDSYNMVKFVCCGKLRSEFKLEDGDEELVCYKAEHTVDQQLVKYFTRDSFNETTKEEGTKHRSWNPNVCTCKVMKCGKGKSAE